MFGMSAAYIRATKGVTCPNQRALIRYCITDVYVSMGVVLKMGMRFNVRKTK